MRIFYHILRILLAFFLIISAWSKSIEPYLFSELLNEYFEIINIDVKFIYRGFMTIILCTTELYIGLKMLFNQISRFLLITTIVLISFFTILLIFFNFSNVTINSCGCIGEVIPMTINESITKNVILLIISLMVYNKFFSCNKLTNIVQRNIINIHYFVLSVCVPLFFFYNIPLYLVGEMKLEHPFPQNVILLDENFDNITDTIINTRGRYILVLTKGHDELNNDMLRVLNNHYSKSHSIIECHIGNIYNEKVSKTIENDNQIYLPSEEFQKISNNREIIIMVEAGIVKYKVSVNHFSYFLLEHYSLKTVHIIQMAVTILFWVIWLFLITLPTLVGKSKIRNHYAKL